MKIIWNIRKYIVILFAFILISCQSKIISLSKTAPMLTSTNMPVTIDKMALENSPTTIKTIVSTYKTNNSTINTNTPTVTNISAGLSEQGPWLVFNADDGIWAMNSDGTGITHIIEKPNLHNNINGSISYIPFTAAPRGNRLAFSLENNGEEQSSVLLDHYLHYEPYLQIMTFPDLSIKTITTLFSTTQVHAITQNKPEISSQDQEDQLDEVEAAITRSGSLAWSSTGDKLAFSAAIDGPSSDVYLFNLYTSRIMRLTNGPKTQAIQISWSPDDKYVLNTAATNIIPQGSGSSIDNGSIWVADSNGEDVHQILLGGGYIKRWFTNDDILAASVSGACPIEPYDLREENIQTIKDTSVWGGLFDDADIDSETKTILIGTAIQEKELGVFTCAQLLDPGVYLYNRGGDRPNYIGYFTQEYFQEPLVITWSDIINKYLVQSSNGITMVSSSGEASNPIDMNSTYNSESFSIPIISPNGQYWVLQSTTSNGLWIRNQDGSVINIYNNPSCKVIWRPDSNAIFFTDGNNPGSIFIAEAPKFIVKNIASGLSLTCDSDLQWVK